MTVQIPWAPGALFLHLVCRLGEPRPDGSDDGIQPDLMSQAGTVTLTCDTDRIRFPESDGRKRMLSMNEWSFSIRASDGELFTPSGEVGVEVLSALTPGIDPSQFTWTAKVKPTSGKPWSVVIPPTASGTVDLVELAEGGAPSSGVPSLVGRVDALEARPSAYPVQQVALTGNLAYTLPPDAPSDQVISVVFKQPATPPTGYTVTYGAGIDGAQAPIRTEPSAATIVELYPIGGSQWRAYSDSLEPIVAIVATEPTFTDLSGTADDRYVIPSQAGVTYRVGSTITAAGTYTPTAGATVTITAEASSGYTLTGTTSWSWTYSTATTNTAPSLTLGTATITDLTISQPFTTADSDGDPVTVTVDWGDGTTGTVTSPATHTYATSGEKSATFTPNDGTTNGAVRQATYNTQAPAGAGVVTDSFNRANSTTGLGSTDTGQPWVQLGTGIVGIDNNQAYAATSFAFAVVDYGSPNMRVSIKQAVPGDYFSGICARNAADGSSGYQIDTGSGSGSTAKVWSKNTAGVDTPITSGYPITAGDTLTLSCKDVSGGTEVKLIVNGATLQTVLVTDPLRPMGTWAGIRPYNNGNIRLDDFRIEAP